MSAPKDLRYLETHEWHRRDGNTVTIGITQFAADELTDITYVALPKIGEKVSTGQRFGEIESVKATSDLYSGVSGTVQAVNEKLNDEPGLVNRDPFGDGWIVKIAMSNPAELEKLLTADAYNKKIGE